MASPDDLYKVAYRHSKYPGLPDKPWACAISYDDSPAVDAFGRLRTSQGTLQYALTQSDNVHPFEVDVETIGTGAHAHDSSNARANMTTAADADAVVAQTFSRFAYRALQSRLVALTFADFEPVSNATKRVGYFSSSFVSPFTADLDGIFLESNPDGNVYINIYKDGVATHRVAQSAFNIDKLDGKGPSNVIVDWSQMAILEIDFQYLGAGRIRFALNINGIVIPFHQALNANIVDSPYMIRPNQPLRWELRQTGAGSASFNYICAAVETEGSPDEIGVPYVQYTPISAPVALAVAGTTYAVCGVRLDSTKLNGIINPVNFELYSLAGGSTREFQWDLRINPTIAGSPSWADISTSSAEGFAGATANTVTGGTLLQAGFGATANIVGRSISSARNIGYAIDGTQDTLVLCATPEANNANVVGALNFLEQI